LTVISQCDLEGQHDTYFKENNSVLAENTHKVTHKQSLGDRNLLDEARQLIISAGKDIRRGNRERGLWAFRPHSRSTLSA
jgi:hypothetical protein